MQPDPQLSPILKPAEAAETVAVAAAEAVGAEHDSDDNHSWLPPLLLLLVRLLPLLLLLLRMLLLALSLDGTSRKYLDAGADHVWWLSFLFGVRLHEPSVTQQRFPAKLHVLRVSRLRPKSKVL